MKKMEEQAQQNVLAQAQLDYYRHEPTRTDKIGQYLYMLYEAQKCGHDVHKEISEALNAYKEELGV
jgi:hypothetical protein